MTESSYRTSLRSSSILGGSQIVTIVASLVKMKAVAIVLGPIGVGLVGLYTNLISTAASISALGVNTTGVRQIANAESRGGENAVGRTRRALFWGSIALALSGSALFWAFSDWIADFVLTDETRSADIAWLSIGIALTVMATSQSALLTGLRRIGDLARLNVGAGFIGALVGILALRLSPDYGLIVMVLAAPALSFAFGRFYILRLGRPAGPRPKFSELIPEWRAMARLGLAFMLSGVVVLLGQLAVRTLVQRELGSEALGQFQAAWSISTTYLGFVLGAMSTDYFPRLTAVIKDHAQAVKLINEQAEVSLLLCAPVVLGMLAFSPWLIRLLYSAEFTPAVEVLRWQLMGDVFKVMSWPLAYIQQARGAGKVFLLTETLASLLMAFLVLIGLPYLGIAATGIAFLAVYVLYLPLMWWLGRRWLGFRWSRPMVFQAGAVLIAAVVVDVACRASNTLGAIVGGTLAVVIAIFALIRLSSLAELDGRMGRIVAYGVAILASITGIRKRKGVNSSLDDHS